MATGRQTSSQKKVWSFLFDISDPSVNWLDTILYTDIVLKHNSVLTYSCIKYFQDMSNPVYTGLEIVINVAGIDINDQVFPFSNTVNRYQLCSHFQNTVLTPAPLNDPITQLNPANEFIAVYVLSMPPGAVGVPLVFECVVEITELNI